MDKKKIFTVVGLGIAAVALLFTNDKVREEAGKLVNKAKDATKEISNFLK